MDKVSKQIRSVEDSVARYIFKKYILGVDIGGDVNKETEANLESNPEMDSSNSDNEEDPGEPNPESRINTAEIKDQRKQEIEQLYKIFHNRVFIMERSIGVLDPETELCREIEEIKIADEAYEKDPDHFKPGEYDSLPDILRCTFIRKHKHRYYRCRNRIMNDDCDICYKHEDSENIYIDIYNDLVDKLIKP
jgi:hypothetical protein